MTHWALRLLSILLLVNTNVSFAYEVETHEDISERAALASALEKEGSLLSNLGLQQLPIDSRDQRFPNYTEEPRTVVQLIRDGSRFEDNGSRATNHFYDPYHNVPASSCGREYGWRSPDWALEDQDENPDQDDSYADTRQFFLHALTKPTEEEREAAWGRTFQGLGQVIHHIQDMAQPQHVRNDLHFSGLRDLIGYQGEVRCLGGPSFYEHYTNLDEERNRIRTNLPYIGSSGYPAVYGEDTTTFTTPRKFWLTNAGEGLADYTNRGFVSAGTNFFDDLNTFPSPSRPISREEDMTAECNRFNVPRPLDAGGNRLPCLMSFIETTVQDKYRKLETTNKRTSTYSIYNAEYAVPQHQPLHP